MVRSSSVLTAGKIKFSSPADFVNCLASFRGRFRPNKYHWRKGRPWVPKSIAQLARDMYLTGCQKDTRSLMEYRMSEKVKLLLDCEFKTHVQMSVDAAFARVQTDALEPLFKFILARTGESISVDELAIEEACRQVTTTDGLPTWKQSFHVIFPGICLTASSIYDLIEHLGLPAMVDRNPWRGKALLSHVDWHLPKRRQYFSCRHW